MNSKLKYVTLTGVDDKTDLHQLISLSVKYPLVEWGILYSPKQQGLGGRYPSVDKLQHILSTIPSDVKIALHLCGSSVPGLFSGDELVVDLVNTVAKRCGRVQLNFTHNSGKVDIKDISNLLYNLPDLTVITQHNLANDSVWKNLLGHKNFNVLFDSSGGRGIERNIWPAPLPVPCCGYAGGLGPDNLARQLPVITDAAAQEPFWIDMEGKLRDKDDLFDLTKAEECLKLVYKYSEQKLLKV